MLRFYISSFLLLLSNWGSSQIEYVLSPDSKIEIKGTSTLHDWTCEAKDFNGSVQLLDETSGLFFQNIDLTFSVDSINGGKGKAMDKKIRKALKSNEFPFIQFVAKKIPLLSGEDIKTLEQFRLRIPGTLSIAGKSQEIQLEVEGVQTKKSFTIISTYSMKMSDFEIKPPSAMFGQIVTGDEIRILFNLILYPKEKMEKDK